MKKWVLAVLMILVISSLAFVYAENQGNNDNESNKSQVNSNIKTKIVNNTKFVPWQKRNESECPTGCKCVGAVVSCPTADGKIMTITAGNSGNVITIIVNKTEVNTSLELEHETEEKKEKPECKTNGTIDRWEYKEGNETKQKYTRCKNCTVICDLIGTMSEGWYKVCSDNSKALIAYDNCSEGTRRLMANLSNGRKAEIKVMPDTASEKAIERLGRLNWTIELKEVGKGDDAKLEYELQAEKEGKFLGIIKTKAKILARINAENGNVDYAKKPWWAFLASGI